MDQIALLQNIGAQVRKHRKSSGLTQEELATRCGVFRSYLSRIEGGTANPSIVVLNTLADALAVDMSELLKNSL
jgi:transcriptional regulator with XRE-family HTH domain